MGETALIKVEELNPIELFTEGGIDNILNQIKEKVERHVPDVSTAQGRKDIASLARKVASSKVILDDMGKRVVADWKAKSKKVDAERKKAKDTLDAMRDEARRPLTEWEAVEQAKEDALHLAAEIELAEDDAYAEESLLKRERAVVAKEAEAARQKAEQEQKEHEDRIAREAAERATRDAEMALQKEKERADQAEARARREQDAAVQAVKDEADRKEQERIAAEKAEQAAVERRASNKLHRAKVNREAVRSLMNMVPMEEPSAVGLIAIIADGKIDNVTIQY